MKTLELLLLICGLPAVSSAQDALGSLRPPVSVEASDHPWDGGEAVDLRIELSPDDGDGSDASPVLYYMVKRSSEYRGLYAEINPVTVDARDRRRGWIRTVIGECDRGEPYYFRVWAVGAGESRSDFVETTEPVRPVREWFAGRRLWAGVITLIICGSVIGFIELARRGRKLKVRVIAGLEAVEEAVGRATEMGRSCLFVPGIADMNDMQSIAGLTILSRVAQQAAEYGVPMEVPTSKALVMTAAQETVESAFLAAGRPDEFNRDAIYYVTDEQFGFVAYLSGLMVREEPAACFYLGSFFAESLILAETGNSIGAIQIAGTAQPAQLPFFVAACDYTLIGEEFFAASAYLSGDPEQLGSLKGQDVGKIIVAALIVIGCALATISEMTGSEAVRAIATFLTDTVLRSGS